MAATDHRGGILCQLLCRVALTDRELGFKHTHGGSACACARFVRASDVYKIQECVRACVSCDEYTSHVVHSMYTTHMPTYSSRAQRARNMLHVCDACQERVHKRARAHVCLYVNAPIRHKDTKGRTFQTIYPYIHPFHSNTKTTSALTTPTPQTPFQPPTPGVHCVRRACVRRLLCQLAGERESVTYMGVVCFQQISHTRSHICSCAAGKYAYHCVCF